MQSKYENAAIYHNFGLKQYKQNVYLRTQKRWINFMCKLCMHVHGSWQYNMISSYGTDLM